MVPVFINNNNNNNHDYHHHYHHHQGAWRRSAVVNVVNRHWVRLLRGWVTVCRR